MAFTKEIIRESDGVAIKYWKPYALNYDAASGDTTLILVGFVSKDVATAGLNPVEYKTYRIPSGTSPELASAVNEFAQNYALAQHEFSGATVET
jgi:hypothetical protein